MSEVVQIPDSGAGLSSQIGTIINNIHNTLILQNLTASALHKKLDEIFTIISKFFPDANNLTTDQFLTILDKIIEMNKCSEERYTRVLGGEKIVRKTTHPTNELMSH